MYRLTVEVVESARLVGGRGRCSCEVLRDAGSQLAINEYGGAYSALRQQLSFGEWM